MTKYKKGDSVVLLSIPFGDEEDWAYMRPGVPYDGVGEVRTVDKVRNYPHGVWYDVAGWVVQARNLRKAAE